MTTDIRTVKTRVQQAQTFARENTTLVACAVTAVVASKLTYNVTVDHCMQKFAAYVTEAEHMKQAAAVVELQRDVLLDFVNDNDMKNEVIDFIKTR